MKILVYADVGLGLIDGSTIWVSSIAEVLTMREGHQVTVLSRDELQDRGVSLSLQRMESVGLITRREVLDAADSPLDPSSDVQTALAIQRADELDNYDRIIVRAPGVVTHLARRNLAHKVWAYVLASPSLDATETPGALHETVERVAGVIVQSDAQRALLEALEPGAAHKTSVLPPMIKPVHTDPHLPRSAPGTVSFVYSGKYSASWNVESFFDIVGECAAEGISAAVTMAGDKVHHEPTDPDFRKRILRKFTDTPGVNWLGGLPREEAIAEASRHDLGLCWRRPELDDSLEISTKFLEFASQGVPALVNRTAAYVELLGDDYPYFAASMADVVSAARHVRDHPDEHEGLRAQVRDVAAQFSFEAAARRLETALRTEPLFEPLPPTLRRNVLIASHDLKFLNTATRWLDDSETYHVEYDVWPSTQVHDARRSRAAVAWADVIFCEWCAGPAIWYSQNKRPEQRLYLRLHRFEAFTDMPRQVDIDAVDGVIVVSEYLRDYCCEQFGWPLEKIVVLPQYCVAEQFDRPKFLGAEHTLGLVGINSFLKRPDLAVQILQRVRSHDERFRLRIRSAMPWEISWLWSNTDEQARYLEFFNALESDGHLREAVYFDRPGSDMAEWYRKVGFILSTSDIEGCHTAVAEGMCSGAWPAVINWAGADTVYPGYVHDSVEAIAESIVQMASSAESDRRAMQVKAREDFDIARTMRQLEAWLS